MLKTVTENRITIKIENCSREMTGQRRIEKRTKTRIQKKL
jgi:hypothetical protein